MQAFRRNDLGAHGATCLKMPGRLALTVALLLASSSPLAAQSIGRTLTGIVTDRQHEPLSGAVVQVQDQANGSVVSYLTNTSGQYSFKRLGLNSDYSVWATYRKHKSKVKQMSHFDSKAAKVVNLMITLD